MRNTRSSSTTVVLLLVVLSTSRSLHAQSMGDSIVPEDTAILEVQASPSVKIAINGDDYGAQRKFEFEPLERGRSYEYNLAATFPDGGKVTRKLLLKGGQRVRLPIVNPKKQLPELALQAGHSAGLWCVALSTGGGHVLTGSGDETAILRDATTGNQLRTFDGHDGEITSVALSGNGRRALTGSVDSTAILWDTTTGNKLHTFGHTNEVYSVALSNDGRRALTGAETAILWDAATGNKLHTFAVPDSSVKSVALSNDGRRALIGWWDNTAILWDLTTGIKLRIFAGHTDMVNSVALSADGRRALTASGDKTAILWDTNTGKNLRTFAGYRGALSGDSRYVLTCSGEKTATLWDAATGNKLHTFAAHQSRVMGVAFSENGRRALTGSMDKTAILWDAATGNKLRTFTSHQSRVTSVVSSNSGRRVLTGFWHKTAILWDAMIGSELRNLSGHTDFVTSVALSADGRRALTGSWDKTAILWSTDTGENSRVFAGHTMDVQSVALSGDDRRALTGSVDSTAILWDTTTGNKLHTFGHTDQVSSVALSKDGRRALTGSMDKTAILWDADTGKKVRTFAGHNGHDWGVASVALSSDGRHGLTGSWDKTAILWDATTGKKVHTFVGHNLVVMSVALSIDGRHVVTGSWDKTAILWDATTGNKLRTFSGHQSRVFSVALSSDGRSVLTGSGDGTTRLWDVATGDELVRLISLDAGKDWLVVTPEGLFDGSAGGRNSVMYRVGEGLNVVPVDRFFQDFYYPGLLAAIWRGERPMPTVDFGKSSPPTVKIVRPQQGGDRADPTVSIEVDVTDTGSGINGPWLRHNGSKIRAAGEAKQTGTTLRQTFTVRLVAGENRIRVEAASGDGSWESEPAKISFNYVESLDRPDLYVVAIGVNKYADETMNLRYATRDAESMAKLFQQRGNTLYSKVHATLLLDDKATKRSIRKTLREISEQAQPQDTFLVFISGHGFAIGQRYYFIPHEFESDSPRFADNVRDFGYPSDELADAIGAVPSLKRLLILDTCNSGAAIGKSGSQGRNPFAFRGAIERLSRAQGIFTIAASASSEDTVEINELKHGVLTYSLLAGLNAASGGPLSDHSVKPTGESNVIGALDWFSYASDRVPELTKKYIGTAQDVKVSGEGNSFPVLPLNE